MPFHGMTFSSKAVMLRLLSSAEEAEVPEEDADGDILTHPAHLYKKTRMTFRPIGLLGHSHGVLMIRCFIGK